MLKAMLLTGVTALIFSGGTQGAMAKDYFLASGRWDNVVLVIDLEKAIDPANDGTPKAVVNRLRVTPDIDAIGTGKTDDLQRPADHHHDRARQQARLCRQPFRPRPSRKLAAAFQHGHAGTVTVVDLTKALDPDQQRHARGGRGLYRDRRLRADRLRHRGRRQARRARPCRARGRRGWRPPYQHRRSAPPTR